MRDPDFGVRARHFGLERRVEMYQWREDGGRYLRQWSSSPVDSSEFAPGHSNPPFPLHGQRWVARDVSVDGVALDQEVLQALGSWHEFRPGFSALPGNLAATFQPEGDGLGSAENPLAPEIGDLRIHWLQLLLPPLQDRIELRDGRWQLRAIAARDPAQAAVATQPAADPGGKRGPWWIWASGLVLVLLGVVALGRRRRR
ncbi:MAG: TMEM43 family protein [Luteimonas sp.]